MQLGPNASLGITQCLTLDVLTDIADKINVRTVGRCWQYLRTVRHLSGSKINGIGMCVAQNTHAHYHYNIKSFHAL